MEKIYPNIDILRSHTNLDILSEENKLRNIKSLSSKKGKHIWQVLFSDKNGISSVIIKCSKLPQSLIEYRIYKGDIHDLVEFLPRTYGQWQNEEWYCVAIEHVSILPKYNSFKSQQNIIELVAKLHAQFPESKVNKSWIPSWKNFDPKYLKKYFSELEQKSKDKNFNIPSAYKDVVGKGIKILPELLEETKQFPHSLIHGDVHRINTGLSDSNGLIFIDWENAQLAPSTFDIVWLLERTLAYNPIEQVQFLRKWGISCYLRSLEKHGVIREENSFLLEYKLIYIYLVLTSIIWNYSNKSKKNDVLEHHLATFSQWANKLNLL